MSAPASGNPNHYASLLQGSAPSRARSRRLKKLQPLLKHSIFTQLTAIAGIMVIINIVQAVLIGYLRSFAWIVIFPLVVFMMLLALLLLSTYFNRKDLTESWTKASVPERAAWIGVILSILLPIIICEFFYLPLVAVPNYNTVKWSTDLQVASELLLPAVLIVPQSQGIQWTAFDCYRGTTHCNVTITALSFAGEDPIQALLFNPLTQPNGTDGKLYQPASDTTTGFIELYFGFLYNATESTKALFEFSFLDPYILDSYISLNSSERSFDCGDPPYHSTMILNFQRYSSAVIDLDVSTLEDNARALAAERNYANASDCASKYTHFEHYTPNLLSEVTETSGNVTFCSPGYTPAVTSDGSISCSASIQMGYHSMLTTSKISNYGTSTLDILIDEGSIIGGVLFFTWFFGIFII